MSSFIECESNYAYSGHAEMPDVTAREKLLAEAAPYQLYFSDGCEGSLTNPETAGWNSDTLLVMADMIRNRQTAFKVKSAEGQNIGWATDPKYDWYFESYCDKGITPKCVSTPVKIVRIWLEKIGPQNDMAGSESDLTAARQWLIENRHSRKTKNGSSDEEKALNLILDLDLELSETAQTLDKKQFYLAEASEIITSLIEKSTGPNNLKSRLNLSMKLAAANIELARIKYLGTGNLTDTFDEYDYLKFEQDCEENLGWLSQMFCSNLAATAGFFNEEEYASKYGRETDWVQEYSRYLGMYFEMFTYIKHIDRIIESGKLAAERFRPGTKREESGTCHKLEYNGNSLGGSFNLNFDFRHDAVVRVGNNSHPLTRIAYIQNKIKVSRDHEELMVTVNSLLTAGKEFMYSNPNDLLGVIETGTTRFDTLNNIAYSMYHWCENAFDVRP